MNCVHGRARRWLEESRGKLTLGLACLLVSGPCFAETVFLSFGSNVSTAVQDRVATLLKGVPGVSVAETGVAASGDYVLSIGALDSTRALIPVAPVASESFAIRSAVVNGVTRIAADGPGVSFAAYEILQQLGFRFFHPLRPTTPASLSLSADLSVDEKPRWPVRGLHLHTQHQLEFTHLLNGWGVKGPTDVASFNEMLTEWTLFCEWMLAHRQNTIEWALLASKDTPAFNDSAERQARLTKIIRLSHAWGLRTGIDVGIVFEQQNMWRLLRTMHKKTADDLAEIRTRMDYVFKTGIDFLSIEAGLQEFRAPDDRVSLEWMNEITREASRLGKFAQVKVHISSGQKVKHFKDPDNGQPLNFNFLPHYADKRLAVLPHTVQPYSFDDPAPTYGNTNFQEMRRFLSMEAGARPVIYYPEAAYWCTYDVDVPLFLVSYGVKRVRDLRMIADDEDHSRLGRGRLNGSRMQGQLLFSSGFEWGYWLNNLVAMHAAWNPHTESSSDDQAYRMILSEIFRASDSGQLVSSLSEQAAAEDDLLIHGTVNGKAPRQIEKLTGIAYMAGQETWDELNTFLADKLKMRDVISQPSRVGFAFRSKLTVSGINYLQDVQPLLAEMTRRFSALATSAEKIEASAPIDVRAEAREFAQAARMKALRATQLYGLYDGSSSKPLKKSDDWRDARIATARAAIDQAEKVVRLREREYRTPMSRIAAWGLTPTSYGYGYLWTAHSLQWWWRDEGSALKVRKNFCFMNIVNPADNVFADGTHVIYYKILKVLSKVPFFGALDECLTPSKSEPNPRARVRGAEARQELADNQTDF